MTFLGKENFCVSGHAQFYWLCCTILSGMLTVCHSPAHKFCTFHLSFPALQHLEDFLSCNCVQFPCGFLFQVWFFAMDSKPISWVFHLQSSGIPISFCKSWSGSICNAHIALQELQAVTLNAALSGFSFTW